MKEVVELGNKFVYYGEYSGLKCYQCGFALIHHLDIKTKAFKMNDRGDVEAIPFDRYDFVRAISPGAVPNSVLMVRWNDDGSERILHERNTEDLYVRLASNDELKGLSKDFQSGKINFEYFTNKDDSIKKDIVRFIDEQILLQSKLGRKDKKDKEKPL